jgi:hypothetical protein
MRLTTAMKMTITPPGLDKVPPAAVYMDAHKSTAPGRMAGFTPFFPVGQWGDLSFICGLNQKNIWWP